MRHDRRPKLTATGSPCRRRQRALFHACAGRDRHRLPHMATLPPKVRTLESVMAEFPALCSNGMGVFDAHRKSPDARGRELAQQRGELLQHAEHIAHVADFLRARIRPIQTCTVDSYSLKHAVENAMGVYTTNGEAIAAALMAGYPWKHIEGPNVDFGRSAPDYKALPKQAR